jgi:hypothetical protein
MATGDICKRCVYAQWEYTPTGRIKKHACGRCTFALKQEDLPVVPPHWKDLPSAEYLNRAGMSCGIWPTHMPDCPCFKEKKGKDE